MHNTPIHKHALACLVGTASICKRCMPCHRGQDVGRLTRGDAVEGGLVPGQGLPVLPEAGDSYAIRGRPSQGQEGLQHRLVHSPQPVYQPGVAASRLKQAAQQAGEFLCERCWVQTTAEPGGEHSGDVHVVGACLTSEQG